MDSATWCRTPAAASAARRLRPEVSKNSSTALSSNEGELARSITTCAPATPSFSPSPVMVLMPLLGEAATTSWPPWRRMVTVFEPIRPVPPITTIFIVEPPLSLTGDPYVGSERGRVDRSAMLIDCERHPDGFSENGMDVARDRGFSGRLASPRCTHRGPLQRD